MEPLTRAELTCILAALSNDWQSIDEKIEDTKGYPAETYWKEEKARLFSAYTKITHMKERL